MFRQVFLIGAILLNQELKSLALGLKVWSQRKRSELAYGSPIRAVLISRSQRQILLSGSVATRLGRNRIQELFQVKLLRSIVLSFLLVSCGGGGGSSQALESTMLGASNSPPSATDIEITVEEDSEYSGTFEFTDPDGDAITYAVAEAPSHGSFDLTSDGNYKYVPSADFYGNDSVVIRVSDGTDTVVITLYITVTDVAELTVFREEATVISLSAYPVADKCGDQEFSRGSAVVSEMVFPVNINDDEFKDLLVIFNCPNSAQYSGIEHDLPSVNYIIPFISDETGSYSAVPTEVFGTDFPLIPHMPRKYVRADFNGDGRDDFGLAINHDDGRSNQEVPVQAIVLSQPNNKYSIETITTPQPMMAHAISLARNELGTFDILWGGYCCSPDLYAYRYDNGSWVNVSEKYPQSTVVDLANSDWGTETRADMRFGLKTKRILSHMNYQVSDAEKVIGLNLWRENNGSWSLNDVHERTTEGVVQFINWATGEAQPEPYVTVNGRELLISGVLTENMCIFEENENVTLMIIFPGLGLENSDTFDKEKVYDNSDPELEPVKPLIFFDITNDIFELQTREILQEYLQASGNFFMCADVNNDDLTDIVLQDFSNTWRTDFVKTRSPVVYLQNADGSFSNVNYDPENLLEDEFGGYIGLLSDMNNDGFVDLVRYAIDVRNDPSLEESIRIYYAKEHL